MTHADLVILAARWLRTSHHCTVVLTEWKGGSRHEIPDVIGWRSSGWSVLVEVKASRSDFLAEARKSHRKWTGVGQEKWYFAPRNIIPHDGVPEGWGLCEFTRSSEVRKHAPDSHLLPFDTREETVSLEDRGIRSAGEVKMLVSALSRLSENRGVATLVAAMKHGSADLSALKTLKDVKFAI